MTWNDRISWLALAACMSLWAFVMVVAGLIVIFDLPNRVGFPIRLSLLVGGLLVAGGLFLFSLTASRRFFLGACPLLIGVVELLPWAAFSVVACGAFIWNT